MSASVSAVCVDPKRVHLLWPIVSHWIMDAIERGGDDNFEGTERDVLEGRALLWLAWDGTEIIGAAVTELLTNGLCVIVACGGKQFKLWTGLIGTIEDYARREGCNAVRIIGRSGWARILPGYHTTRVVLEKRI